MNRFRYPLWWIQYKESRRKHRARGNYLHIPISSTLFIALGEMCVDMCTVGYCLAKYEHIIRYKQHRSNANKREATQNRNFSASTVIYRKMHCTRYQRKTFSSFPFCQLGHEENQVNFETGWETKRNLGYSHLNAPDVKLSSKTKATSAIPLSR